MMKRERDRGAQGVSPRDRRIRHLPVVNGEGRLLGLISLGDLKAFEAARAVCGRV